MNIFKYGNKKWFYLTIILSLFSALSGIFTAYVTGEFINIATHGTRYQLWMNIFVSFVGLSFLFLLNLLFVYVKNNLILSCNLAIKQKAFSKFLTATDDSSISEEVSLLTNDLKQVETKGFLNEIAILQNALIFIFAISYGFYLSIEMTVIFFISSCTPLIISKLFSSSIQNSSKNWSSENGKYVGKITDFVKGKDTILNYQAENIVQKLFVHQSFELENALKKMNLYVDSSNQVVLFVANLFVLCLSFGFGIYEVLNHQLLLGSFIAIVQVSNYLINPLIAIATALNEKKTTVDIFNKIEEDSLSSKVKPSFLINRLDIIDGGISLNQKVLFRHLNMHIEKGDKILIIAPSGYGKSTLLRALGGYIEFTEGSYFINNDDSASYDLRSSFAYIKQSPFIFNESILFNITMGLEYEQSELEDVLKQSVLEDLVKEKGLDYNVGENGENLSGGQLQRIEIARGLLSQRNIILADEISSALDTVTSQKIFDYLMNSTKTLIEVSHRVSKEQQSQYTKVYNLANLPES